MSIDGYPARGPWSPKVTTAANRPANPLVGQMIFELDTKIAYIWTGSNWREVSAPRYAAMLYRNTNIAVAGGFAFTLVPMTTLSWADDNVVFQGGQNYTCPIAGLYRTTANIQLDTGEMSAIQIRYAGSDMEGPRTQNPSRAIGHNMTVMGPMNAGGVIEAGIWNDGGAATNVREGPAFTWMMVERIGPRYDSGYVL